MFRTMLATGSVVAALLGGGVAAQAAPAQNYTLTVVNNSVITFDDVVVSLTKFSNPNAVFLGQRTLPPGQRKVFDLGPCNDVKQFIQGISYGTNFKSTGTILPQPDCTTEVVWGNP
ncbi:hypothetical protein D5S17_28420 [Pseudonocardiaceae bacterium YIM PH 21723]|nr:hypothetical protein D5S17_28420 [Pseudonocardiaceae bacterium YIM PH 21723]